MPIVNKKVQGAIARATILNRLIKEAQEELEGLKVLVREEATKVASKRGDDEKVEFESPEGVATVVFVSDRASLVKGANPALLKETLPMTVWENLFQETIVLSKQFPDAFGLLTRTQQTSVKKLVEWKPCEPRVTLPK
jgi:hypothetical protein